MINHSKIAVGNETPYRLSPAGVHSGVDLTVQNLSSTEYIYLGSENVSFFNFGYRLAPGHAFSIELPGTDAIYAISLNGLVEVAVLTANLETGR